MSFWFSFDLKQAYKFDISIEIALLYDLKSGPKFYNNSDFYSLYTKETIETIELYWALLIIFYDFQIIFKHYKTKILNN